MGPGLLAGWAGSPPGCGPTSGCWAGCLRVQLRGDVVSLAARSQPVQCSLRPSSVPDLVGVCPLSFTWWVYVLGACPCVESCSYTNSAHTFQSYSGQIGFGFWNYLPLR